MITLIKKVNTNAIMPKFEYEGDTGFSLYTCEDITIKPRERLPISTGVCFEFEEGYAFQIKCRSGITLYGVPTTDGKQSKITIYEGTIDNNYRGAVSVIVENNERHSITIPRGTKIAQGVIIKTYQCQFVEVSNLTDTDRGGNGFGSTGAN